MAQAQLLRAVTARRYPLLMALAAGALVGIGSPLLALVQDEIDVAGVRARAKGAEADVDRLVEAIRRRSAVMRDEALKVAEAATVQRGPAAGPPAKARAAFDLDEMVRSANQMTSGEDRPRLIVFASLAMPTASLRALVTDVSRAGGSIVFRGLPGNSAGTFTTALAKVLPQGEVAAGIGIDPRLFRAFAVNLVPTYVVTTGEVDLCDGFDCRTTPPPHDVLRGNVTLAHALRTFAGGNGPGAAAAAVFERRLEARP